MEIIKFSKFNEAVQIKHFDLVIDSEGYIAYDGEFPIKGNLDKLNNRILGSDAKEYIAAIDRSGNLFSFLEKDIDGNILLYGEKVEDRDLISKNRFWNINVNYTDLLPLLPTGWVNVKIDMEVIKKIRRYSAGITHKMGIEGFKERLSVIGRTDIKLRKRSSETIRREMSAIMMLHYLNELKTHFDPSSSGFLFESYIAGLITGSIVKEDNSPIDVEDKQGNRYQVKLLDFENFKSGIITVEGEYLEYYIVGLKYADKVKVFLLNGIDKESENYVGKFRVRPTKTRAKENKPAQYNHSYAFSYSYFKKYQDTTNYFVYDLHILGIRERIDKIAKGLKNTLDSLYKNLSSFQFNVETILTGVDEKGNILSGREFDNIQKESLFNINEMKTELDSLIGIVKRGG